MIFSSGIWAYVWVAIVLLVSSPNKVELWEAIVTFLMFPSLIGIAYLADRDFCIKRKSKKKYDVEEVGISMSKYNYIISWMCLMVVFVSIDTHI